MSQRQSTQFHGIYDASPQYEAAQIASHPWVRAPAAKQKALRFRFSPHFHPYVDKLVKRLVEESFSGLQSADTDYRIDNNGEWQRFADDHPDASRRGKPIPTLYEVLFSSTRYQPTGLVQQPHPVKELDFSANGAYAAYNWELFFHVPLTVAINLSKNQRFEEAQRWLHYIFDPTDDSDGPTPERFWKVKPFHGADIKRIEEILINLSTGDDPQLQQDTIDSIGAWKDSPFRPHVVARYRPTAYMYKTVMAYLDNLIDWGDSLFRQDTLESLDEATQLYVLSANILGPRPQAVPSKGNVLPKTYAQMRKQINEFGNAQVDLETDIAFDIAPHPTAVSSTGELKAVNSIAQTLYFCVPRNDKLVSYWDTVADRLFKIRNSLNIQGTFRQLALFDPPIDPALLAKAAAAGLDIGSIISGLNQPLPLVRFQLLVQKATEICQEVKSLGNNLLSAIEKHDGEALSVLRAQHELVILDMAETVKYSQLQEAIKSREGLELSLENAKQRYAYYQRQLGKPDLVSIKADAIDSGALEKGTGFATTEPVTPQEEIEVDIAPDLLQIGGGALMSSWELRELSDLAIAQGHHESATDIHEVAARLAIIPHVSANVQPFGTGASVTFGGNELSSVERFFAGGHEAKAQRLSYEAGKTAKVGSYARRKQEWTFQSNLAAGEINLIYKQLRAAQIREAIAEFELKNHRQQIKHAKAIQGFLDGEKTSIGASNPAHKRTSTLAFYAWLRREVKGLHSQCFQFAFDVARKAERALQRELGDSKLSFLQFGYMSGKEGLLAGEKLHLDLKRMEMAYHELNQREYELTKHVSVLQVAPLELMKLRAIGRCIVSLPEELFDMDGPGHYFRRIKSVAVSIPCVAGPYTSVSCTLTLQRSSIRTNSLLLEGSYARESAEDTRFSDYFGSLQSIVTSNAQSDSGLFEANLRDERYLPFEGSGAISQWQLELPAEFRQFDYDTIADVILHLRYTARAGGGLLRSGAIDNLKTRIAEAKKEAGTSRLFSIRHEFPSEWAKFQNQAPADGQRFELALTLRAEHYPYWAQDQLESVSRVDILARPKASDDDAGSASANSLDIFDKADPGDTTASQDSLNKDSTYGSLLVGRLDKIPLPAGAVSKTPDKFRLYFAANNGKNPLDELWIAVTWSSESN